MFLLLKGGRLPNRLAPKASIPTGLSATFFLLPGRNEVEQTTHCQVQSQETALYTPGGSLALSTVCFY